MKKQSSFGVLCGHIVGGEPLEKVFIKLIGKRFIVEYEEEN